MNISSFFLQLRSAYQSEMDDLSSDSEGKDVLKKRLADKCKQLSFLIQMAEINPEMVAVVFHQGFRFPLPAVMDNLLSLESDEFPEWGSLADAVQLAPWAQDLARVILQEPIGGWFMTVAAGLEYLYSKPDARVAAHDGDEDDRDPDDEDNDALNERDAEEEAEDRAREEAGADWMVEQGFDRKD